MSTTLNTEQPIVVHFLKTAVETAMDAVVDLALDAADFVRKLFPASEPAPRAESLSPNSRNSAGVPLLEGRVSALLNAEEDQIS